MQDRIPLYPGRVKMTPVAGQANTYDMVRADDPTQAGTPLNKATFLKDATAALYGLGTGAVPDDVLAWIGAYNTYWWRKRVPAGEQWVEQKADITSNVDGGDIEKGSKFQYSTRIYLSQENGNITLENPQTYIFTTSNTYQNITEITTLAPCYTLGGDGKVYYLPEGVSYNGISNSSSFSFSNTGGDDDYYYVIFVSNTTAVKVQKVTSIKKIIPAGDWEYLQSSTRSAYPDSGTQDGYEYEYLGIPFDNAVTAPKIETGRYEGSGYGPSNPTSITFSFIPKVVILASDSPPIVLINPMTAGASSATSDSSKTTNFVDLTVTWSGKAVSWHVPSDSTYNGYTKQMVSGYYVAFG